MIHRIPLKLRTFELREAQIFGYIRRAFKDVPDVVERNRWATIDNVFSGVNLDLLNHQYEFWCEVNGDVIDFCVVEWYDPCTFEDEPTVDEIAELIPI